MSDNISTTIRQLEIKYENKLKEFLREIEEDEKNIILATRKSGKGNYTGATLLRRFKTDVSNIIPKLVYMKNIRDTE